MLSTDLLGRPQSATDPSDECVDSTWEIVGRSLGDMAKQLVTSGFGAMVS